jgi:hypothetical protein
MKKNLILTLILSFVAFAGFTQLELKPAIGINAARFDSNPVFNTTDTNSTGGKAGYQIGASLLIGRKLYVEPGVFYSKFNQDMTPADIEKSNYTYGVGFVRIPVNFGFQFIGSTSSFAALRIYLGPSVMIPVGIKENDYTLAKADVTSPQFDISVGAGLNIWFLFLDVSYGWGLTPQFTDDPIEAKMQAFYTNIGFRFKLKSDSEE